MSPGKLPVPTPQLNRPSAMWSSWAIRLARTKGLWFGMQLTPVPRRIRFVSGIACAMSSSGEGMFSHTAVKCSPIQASEYPSSSSWTIWSRSDFRVSVRLAPGGCSGIVNRPSSISPALLEAGSKQGQASGGGADAQAPPPRERRRPAARAVSR